MLKDISLSCPFCRSEPVRANRPTANYIFVKCSNSASDTYCFLSDVPVMLEHWNRRKDGWLSVKQSVPDSSADVLIRDDQGAVATYFYDADLWSEWGITGWRSILDR